MIVDADFAIKVPEGQRYPTGFDSVYLSDTFKNMLLAYTKGDFKFVRVQLKWLQCIKWVGGGDERCSQGFEGLDQTR